MTFLSDAERIWIRMKDTASQMAATDGRALSMKHALAIVGQIIHEERAQGTPDEARYYFAEELLRMVSEYRTQSPCR
jgi:hypothetical protein